MEEIYNNFLLENYRNPKNKKKIKKRLCGAFKEDFNPLCGDNVKVCLKIKNSVIKEIVFDGEGCVLSQASASILSEKLKNKKLKEVLDISRDDLLKILGLKELSIARIKCAMLPLLAIKKAILEYESKKLI